MAGRTGWMDVVQLKRCQVVGPLSRITVGGARNVAIISVSPITLFPYVDWLTGVLLFVVSSITLYSHADLPFQSGACTTGSIIEIYLIRH